MKIRRIIKDPTRSPEESGLSPTYINLAVHWWDGSQIYGSDEVKNERRSGVGYRRDESSGNHSPLREKSTTAPTRTPSAVIHRAQGRSNKEGKCCSFT